MCVYVYIYLKNLFQLSFIQILTSVPVILDYEKVATFLKKSSHDSALEECRKLL